MSIKKYLDKFPSFDNKTIIVTGANSGVGFELCRHLLYKNANVVMACRNMKRANDARNKLVEEYPSANIEILEYDQSSLKSVKNASDVIKDKYHDFYGLVCNAGILGPIEKGVMTENGFPITIGTNYLGLLYLYENLKYLLDESTITRKVIFQGSIAADLKIPKGMDLLDDQESQWTKYNLSKKCVECLYKYTSINNKNEKVAFILSEPGVSKTSLFNSMNGFLKVVGGFFIRVFSHTPKKASLTMFRCLIEDTKNGDVYLPRGLSRVRGYPKKFPFKEKRYDEAYIKRGYQCLKLK